jgi:hypothetical protein
MSSYDYIRVRDLILDGFSDKLGRFFEFLSDYGKNDIPL